MKNEFMRYSDVFDGVEFVIFVTTLNRSISISLHKVGLFGYHNLIDVHELCLVRISWTISGYMFHMGTLNRLKIIANLTKIDILPC